MEIADHTWPPALERIGRVTRFQPDSAHPESVPGIHERRQDRERVRERIVDSTRVETGEVVPELLDHAFGV
jgi:hypothetical protein